MQLKTTAEIKKLYRLCKKETRTYIAFVAMYGLTAKDKILVQSENTHVAFLFNGRAPILTFSRTQVRFAEHERLQS